MLARRARKSEGEHSAMLARRPRARGASVVEQSGRLGRRAKWEVGHDAGEESAAWMSRADTLPSSSESSQRRKQNICASSIAVASRSTATLSAPLPASSLPTTVWRKAMSL